MVSMASGNPVWRGHRALGSSWHQHQRAICSQVRRIPPPSTNAGRVFTQVTPVRTRPGHVLGPVWRTATQGQGGAPRALYLLGPQSRSWGRSLTHLPTWPRWLLVPVASHTGRGAPHHRAVCLLGVPGITPAGALLVLTVLDQVAGACLPEQGRGCCPQSS